MKNKLMYSYCYKCPCPEEVKEILDNRKALGGIFKKIERVLRVSKRPLSLTYKEVNQLERYILALEFVEESTVSKLNKIKEIL